VITRPRQSCRLWRVIVCDVENPKNEEAMARVGLQRHRNFKKKGLECLLSCFRNLDAPVTAEGTVQS